MLLPRAHRSYAQPLWLLLVFVSAASAGLLPSADGDVWWHLAAGREMVAARSLLFSDPFSLSAAGRPWIDVHWLFQLAVFAVYSRAGLLGLVLTKCALIGTGAVLASLALPGGRSWARPLFATLLFASLFAARSLLLVRPVIGSLVLLAAYGLLLERFRQRGRAWPLVLLPLLQVIWANLQGLSALGPALVGAYALGAGVAALFDGRSPWLARELGRGLSKSRYVGLLAGAFSACLLAGCATPFGWRAVTFPSLLLGRLLPTAENVFSQSIAENVPPFVLEQQTGEFWHFKWMLLALAVTLLLAGRRVRLSHLLILGGFLALALIANRNVLLLYWVATPIAALYLAPRLRVLAVRMGRAGRPVLRLANAGAFIAVSCLCARAVAAEPSLGEPSAFRAPVESARLLAQLPPGPIFNADHQGGYLIWQLYPRFRPYMDTRLVLRTAGEYTEYLGLSDYPERFAKFQARSQFRYVLLPVAFPERYQGLIAELYASSEWRLLFTDGSEVLFGRRDETSSVAGLDLSRDETTDALLAALQERFGASSKLYTAARLHLATLQTLLKEFAQAERVLSRIDAPEARALSARARYAQGDLDTAQRIASTELSRDRHDLSSLNLLALIALRRGQLLQGTMYLRRVLAIAPYDSEATQTLAHLEDPLR